MADSVDAGELAFQLNRSRDGNNPVRFNPVRTMDHVEVSAPLDGLTNDTLAKVNGWVQGHKDSGFTINRETNSLEFNGPQGSGGLPQADVDKLKTGLGSLIDTVEGRNVEGRNNARDLQITPTGNSPNTVATKEPPTGINRNDIEGWGAPDGVRNLDNFKPGPQNGNYHIEGVGDNSKVGKIMPDSPAQQNGNYHIEGVGDNSKVGKIVPDSPAQQNGNYHIEGVGDNSKVGKIMPDSPAQQNGINDTGIDPNNIEPTNVRTRPGETTPSTQQAIHTDAPRTPETKPAQVHHNTNGQAPTASSNQHKPTTQEQHDNSPPQNAMAAMLAKSGFNPQSLSGHTQGPPVAVNHSMQVTGQAANGPKPQVAGAVEVAKGAVDYTDGKAKNMTTPPAVQAELLAAATKIQQQAPSL